MPIISLEKNLEVFGGAKADRAEYRFFAELVNVTKQNIVSKNFFGREKTMENALNEYTNQNTDVAIENISKAIIEDENISFVINAFVEQKTNEGIKLSRQSLKVSQELTDELKNNPELVYVNYLNNKNIKIERIGKQELKKESEMADLVIELPENQLSF